MIVFILASILILLTVGMQESFAQTYDLNDYPGEWYPGEGLKQGDYFSYSICHTDYKECIEFELDMWIKGDVQYGTETKWLAEVVVYDGNKIIVGEMELGKIVPEPTGGSENLGIYRGAFKSSITGISAFVTSDGSSGGKGPKEFSAKSWGKYLSIGAIGEPYPLRAETITTPSGTFDTVVIGWDVEKYNNKDNEFWIVDDFPFPVKGVMHNLSSIDTSENLEFEFELLNYHENIFEDPFQHIISKNESSEQKSEFIDSPRQQIKNGILPWDVICRNGLELIIETSGITSYCVTSNTLEKLIERGWNIFYKIKEKHFDNVTMMNEIRDKCESVHGTWVDKYGECEVSGFPLESCRDGLCMERFESFCSEFDGKYNSCNSPCRYSEDWPNVICTAQCIMVCEFN